MTKTENYQLNQWDAADPIRREDFNSDNAALDAALNAIKNAAEEDMQSLDETVAALTANLGAAGKNCRITWGTYTGTGTYGASNPTGLNVDFYPVLVLVGCPNSLGSQSWPSIFMRNCAASHSDVQANALAVTWTDTGLSWYDTQYADGQLQNNKANVVYYYCVIGYDKSAE